MVSRYELLREGGFDPEADLPLRALVRSLVSEELALALRSEALSEAQMAKRYFCPCEACVRARREGRASEYVPGCTR